MDKTLIKLDALDHASFDIISYKFACHLHHTLFTRDKYFLKFGHIGKFKHFSKIPTMYLSVVFSFIMSYIKMSTSLKLCNKRFLLQNGFLKKTIVNNQFQNLSTFTKNKILMYLPFQFEFFNLNTE
jgi:hypothetical protein